MTSQNYQSSQSGKGWGYGLGIAAAVAGILATIVAVLTFLLGDGILGRSTAPHTAERTNGRYLIAEGPVKVFWTGEGETLDVRWEPMSVRNLNRYTVDVFGGGSIWFVAPYPPGEQRATSRVINPIADTRARYDSLGEKVNVGVNTSWRICVVAERKPDADGSANEIENSRQCTNDYFRVPA